MTDRNSFGAWLRRERERRCITVRAIADRTKIGAGLLESLERGDVSRWPGGIYRRSFMRAYAEAVGLDADLVLANFERLFPEDGTAASRPAVPASPVEGEEPEMRLQLADMGHRLSPAAIRNALTHLALALGFGLAGFAAAGPIGFWCAAAVASIVHQISSTFRVASRPEPAARVARPLATIVSFSDEQNRSMSKRARARRMVADLSAAAIPAASFRRRRAARS